MKKITIYVFGKYEYSSRKGQWIYYIEYNGAVKKDSGFIDNAGSSARMHLVALINALMCITEPCIINIRSKVTLGFASIKRSPNQDLLLHVFNLVNTNGHVISLSVGGDFEKIYKWEEQNKNKETLREEEYYEKLAKEQYMMNHPYEYLEGLV